MTLYSSGKHAALNTQPWRVYVIEDDGRESTVSRWQSQADAEYFAWPDEHVDYDPFVIDALPLTNVPNPYLADLREHGNFDFWRLHLNDLWADSDVPATVHAREVLRRLDFVLGVR